MRFAHVGCALLALGAAGCERLQTPAQRAERAARDSLVRDSTARVVMLREADSLHLRTRVAEWSLPDMRTTGGITLTSDGRLLAADGESGNVAQIDYRNGAVLKAFRLGRQTIQDDFVGIATTGNGDVFELTKTGTIYHFLEGSDGNRVEFLKHDTKLAGVCEFGGLAFSRERNALLLACSVMKHRGDSLAFYWWALAAKDEERLSSFRVATTTHP
ncbi:MAG TPA: hypothetical protein VE967_08875, partial [Gemmatimonadaceae bacterium]|nr:hypothetical protein [Gemmatimonadaceae bacterium]